MDAHRAPEDAELADIIDALGTPDAITLEDIQSRAMGSFHDWLTDRKNRRQIPFRLEGVKYVPVRNPTAEDGLWKIKGKRQAVYARQNLSPRDRITAATERSRR